MVALKNIIIVCKHLVQIWREGQNKETERSSYNRDGVARRFQIQSFFFFYQFFLLFWYVDLFFSYFNLQTPALIDFGTFACFIIRDFTNYFVEIPVVQKKIPISTKVIDGRPLVSRFIIYETISKALVTTFPKIWSNHHTCSNVLNFLFLLLHFYHSFEECEDVSWLLGFY